jgi:hypothetical protein
MSTLLDQSAAWPADDNRRHEAILLPTQKEAPLKYIVPRRRYVAIALTMGMWYLVPACGGDDTTASSGGGGSTGTGGGDASLGGQGGAGGGSGGTSGSGGASGAGGSGGNSRGGSQVTDAGDARPAEAATFTPTILFTFDFTDAGTYGWTADNGSSLRIIDEDRDPANQTPGALRYTAVFPPYDIDAGTSNSVLTQFVYGDPGTATNKTLLAGATRIHMWLRLVSEAPSPSIDHHQPFVQGGAASAYAFRFEYYANNTLSDHQWHEFIIDMSGASNVGTVPYTADLWRIGFQLLPTARPALDAGNDAGTGEAGATPDATGADAAGDVAITDARSADVGSPDAISSDAVPEAASGDTGSVGTDGAADVISPSAPAPAPVVIDIDYIWAE